MFAKSTLLLALFALSAQIAFAASSPPACLLQALNTQQTPSDVKSMCTSQASAVEAAICNYCGSSTSDAMSAFSAGCAAKGVTISTNATCNSTTSSSSSSSSSAATATVTSAPYGKDNNTVIYTSTYFDTVCSCTKTSAISATGTSGSSGFATSTGAIYQTSSYAAGTGTNPIATKPASPTFTGAASHADTGICGTAFIVAAGLLMAI